MEISEVNGLLCSQLDIGGTFTNYESYISSYNYTNFTDGEILNSTFYFAEPVSAISGLNYAFNEGDEIIAYNT